MSRSMAQRMQDDEDHRLAMCGLTPDVRLDWELEDFERRHYDFIDRGPQVCSSGLISANWPRVSALGCPRSIMGLIPREDPAKRASSEFFASGRRDPAPLDAKRGQGMWEGSGLHRSSRALAPPPTSTN